MSFTISHVLEMVTQLPHVGTTGQEVGIRKEQNINDIKTFNETGDFSEATALVHSSLI